MALTGPSRAWPPGDLCELLAAAVGATVESEVLDTEVLEAWPLGTLGPRPYRHLDMCTSLARMLAAAMP